MPNKQFYEPLNISQEHLLKITLNAYIMLDSFFITFFQMSSLFPSRYDVSNADENFIKSRIEEMDHIFELVLLTDYFDESLIMMKHALCWDWDDIIYVKFKMRISEAKTEVSHLGNSCLSEDADNTAELTFLPVPWYVKLTMFYQSTLRAVRNILWIQWTDKLKLLYSTY